MLRTAILPTLLAVLAAGGVGCSDDPETPPLDPGGAALTDQPEAGAPKFGARPNPGEAGVDAAASFRDPKPPADAACTQPNQLCPNGDGGTVCIDVGNDTNNCGACGAQCTGPGAACIAGSCTCTGPEFAYCPSLGGCLDVSSDINNCGACGNVCDPNQFTACASGGCTD